MGRLLKINLLKSSLNRISNKSARSAAGLELRESQKEYGSVQDVKKNLHQTLTI